MGLKIGYRFRFIGSKEELLEKLKILKGQFDDLPVLSVGEIEEIKQASFERGSDISEYHLGYMLLLYFSFHEQTAVQKAHLDFLERVGGVKNIDSLSLRDRKRYARLEKQVHRLSDHRKQRIARSANAVSLSVDVGDGCEYFRITLGRLGDSKAWRGMDCTKTQFADHFVNAHTMVIRLLDLCKEAGILENVSDEGSYWETRDLKVLAENINASTEFMKIASKALTQIGEKKLFVVHNAIDKCANYMNVKSEEQPST